MKAVSCVHQDFWRELALSNFSPFVNDGKINQAAEDLHYTIEDPLTDPLPHSSRRSTLIYYTGNHAGKRMFTIYLDVEM